MAKIDLDSLGIEELAGLRENATDKLFEKVADRDRTIRALQQEMHEKIAEANRIITELQAALARTST